MKAVKFTVTAVSLMSTLVPLGKLQRSPRARKTVGPVEESQISK